MRSQIVEHNLMTEQQQQATVDPTYTMKISSCVCSLTTYHWKAIGNIWCHLTIIEWGASVSSWQDIEPWRRDLKRQFFHPLWDSCWSFHVWGLRGLLSLLQGFLRFGGSSLWTGHWSEYILQEENKTLRAALTESLHHISQSTTLPRENILSANSYEFWLS